jgi:hypothetical protein
MRAGRRGKRRSLVCQIAVAALGLAVLAGCGDDGPEEACSELRADLDELESRFSGSDDQSWDDVRETSDASAERDRLQAEMARAGCASEGE